MMTPRLIALAACAELSLYLGSDVYYDADAAQWYEPVLLNWPNMGEHQQDLEFGLAAPQTVELALADAEGAWLIHDNDWLGSVWRVQLRRLDEAVITDWLQDTLGVDVTPPESTDRVTNPALRTGLQRQLQTDGWQRTPGAIRLQLVDWGWRQGEVIYPPDDYHGGDNLPAIRQDDHGRPIPIVIGHGVKVPAVLISERSYGDPLTFDSTFTHAAAWDADTEGDYGWTLASAGQARHRPNLLAADDEFYYLKPTPALTLLTDTMYRIRLHYHTNSGSVGGIQVGLGQAWSDLYRAQDGWIDVTLLTLTSANLMFRASKNWDGYLRGAPAVTVQIAQPWRYLICERWPHWVYWVDAVYMSGAIANPNSYRVRGTTPNSPWTDPDSIPTYTFGDVAKAYLALDFYDKPADSSGRYYEVAVDITAGQNGINAVTEIRRLLESVGLICDPISFYHAADYAETVAMAVDWAYGARGDAVTLNSLLTDLLTVARARLQLNDAGHIAITVDCPRALDWSWREDLGDLIEGLELSREQPPQTIRVQYQPDVSNPSQLKYRLEYQPAAGYGEVTVDLPMVRAFEAADRYLSYLRGRYEYQAYLRLMVIGQYPMLGDVAAIQIPWLQNNALAAYPWIIASRSFADPNQCELMAYWDHPDRFRYLPSVRPAGAADYAVDNTYTTPGAPTLRMAAVTDAYDAVNGLYTGQVTFMAIVDQPELIQQVHFKLEHAADFTIQMQNPLPLSDDHSQWQAVFAVIPGDQYYLWAWSETYSGLQGKAAWAGFIAYAQNSIAITPSGFSGQVLTNQNYLSWTLAPVTVLTVQVQRHLGDGIWVTVANVSAAATDWSDFAVMADQDYYYRLLFLTRAGAASAYSNTVLLERPA